MSKIRAEEQTQYDAFKEKMLENIGLIYASMYSTAVSQRTKMRMAERAKKGYSLTKPPFGYSQGSERGLYIINNDGRALQACFQDVLIGEMDITYLRSIVSRIYFPLSARGHNTISNKRLMSIVSNVYYSGYISYNGQIYKGLHEYLITFEEQEKLKYLLCNTINISKS